MPIWPARRRLATLVLIPFFATAAAVSVGGPSGAALAQPAVPSSGAYFGASASTRTGETHRDAILRTEAQIGRKLDIDHVFYKWDHTLPHPDESWNVASGRIPFVSWKPQRRDGTTVPWTRITSGVEDAWITAQADRIRDFGHPLFMVFNHEPYDQSTGGWGTPADFVAAWRRIVDIFRARGATNVSWTLVLTAWDYEVSGRAAAFYPGPDYVDWLAADPYNFFTRDGVWRSLSQFTEPFYTWGSARGKPLMLAEWGCEEDPAVPGRRAQWFNDAGAWLKARPNIKAVVYFNNKHAPYDWSIDLTASSLAAFTAMGADPWFNPTTVAPTTTTTAAPTTTTSTTVPPTTTTTVPPTTSTTVPPTTTTTVPPTTTTTTAPPAPVTRTVVFPAAADALVNRANPTRNYGRSTTLISDRSPETEAFVRFDVAGLEGRVSTARLRLYVTDKSGNGPELYPTGTGWAEGTITWNNRPARTGPLAGDLGSVSAGRWVTYDVTAVVTGNGSVSFVLAGDSKDGTDFRSKESAGNRPELVVEVAP